MVEDNNCNAQKYKLEYMELIMDVVCYFREDDKKGPFAKSLRKWLCTCPEEEKFTWRRTGSAGPLQFV